ncbi:class I SAM-dependent methyltransferase [Geofilum sp. OHC36d9]|uniref:class I SAM-dependent methyltransferase n=1 Tax=Geofilum sp. OHC36d9 TaxID=3458413 RepID=UPI004033C5A0
MKGMWNERYKVEQYVYGKIPNLFFKETIDALNYKGNMLFPAEGEGRNAVYAAKKGHSVLAFDTSQAGKSKALKLAEEEGVYIDYLVGEVDDLNLKEETFDIAVLISAHFPPAIRKDTHHKIGKLIKPGGFIILEGFSENNLIYREQNPNIGGPDKKEMLFTQEMIANDFVGFDIAKLEEIEIKLKEGILHNGLAKVIRFIGKKKEEIVTL